MSPEEQMRKAIELVEEAENEGKVITIPQAIKKLHAEYIRRQLNNKYGVKSSGFLIVAGLCSKDQNGWKVENKKLHRIFDEFIAGNNKLTGESGIKLREAMDRFDIDYLNCPFCPLEPLKHVA